MELYLDSADINEIKETFELGFLNGLTTTPTFMHRHGITDVDGLIIELSKIVPVLQIEALGENAEEIHKEAQRLLALGLDKQKTVFKIPVSLEGVKACKLLRNNGLLVNVHLVYTLQQAYMAMQAGANYVCPLVGRLQDEGHDALALVEECVNAVNYYGYDTKIMFSSVRNAEHIRNAIQVGVHSITVPYKIMQRLTENNFTALGTNQFFEHTRLMTVKVEEAIRPVNPTVSLNITIKDALVSLTKFGFGCVSILDKDGSLKGVFSDGDLRRFLQKSLDIDQPLSTLKFKSPITIKASELLINASDLFRKEQVDTIVVLGENEKPIGMLDIQDLNQ